MRTQNESAAIGVTRIAIGLSTSIAVSPIAYQSRIEIGQISGDTMLISGATGSWASARPFIAASQEFDHFSCDGAPTLYLMAQSATCIAHVTYYLTQIP